MLPKQTRHIHHYESKPPCRACGLRPIGGHDACIANLPFTLAACCGHAIGRGYVYMDDGTVFRFPPGMLGYEIDEAVHAIICEEPLPPGFILDPPQTEEEEHTRYMFYEHYYRKLYPEMFSSRRR